MDTTQTLSLLVASRLATIEASSALPDAPVVADRGAHARPLYKTRFATATVLRRAAARIVPA
jgi:hypothetical protein